MPINDFLLWGTAVNANVLSQPTYLSRPDRLSGAVQGKASAQAFNKSQRQSSIISSMVAQFICDRLNVDALDDGTINTLETNFIAAVRSTFNIGITGVVPGTYGPTMTLAVQADGRITGLSNAGLPPTGVAQGTYIGTTVTVGTDGRITGISSVAYGPLAGANTWTDVNVFGNATSLNPILIANSATTNGAGIGFIGNGSVTPRKWIRVASGVMEWINDAYTRTILSLNDAGNLAAFGTVSGTALTATNGNVTAGNGKLRATLGAFGSGDPQAAALLLDFINGTNGTNYYYHRDPDGTIIQAHTGNSITGQDSVVFPNAFPTNCLEVFACEGNPNGWGPTGANPTILGTSGFSRTSFTVSTVAYASGPKTWAWAGGIGYRYIAVGY